MSVQALSAVLEESEARLGPRLVLIAIANHANELGEKSYPNLETLAREAKLSVRQVQRCIVQLEGLNELQVLQRDGTSNLYRITLPSLINNQQRQIVRGDKSGPEMSSKPSGTKDLVNKGSDDKSGRKKSPLTKWLLEGCQHGSDFCNRRSKFCSRCAAEHRRLLEAWSA